MTGWTTWAGLALIVLLCVDAFVTVLYGTSAGPWTGIQNRAIWKAFRGASRILPGSGWLRGAAPVMALATPLAWIAFLTVGFALIYLPAVGLFSSNPPLTAPDWVKAVYYSGYVTSTLGLGDVTPSGTVWRLLAVVHSAFGFALFSAAITYILSIYSRHTEDSALALHIHDRFREPDTPSWGEPGSEERTVARLTAFDLGARLAGVNVAHQQYPILHYFHPEERSSIVVQVGRLVAFVRRAPEGEVEAAALRRTLEGFLQHMPFPTGDPAEDDLETRYRRLVEAHGHDPAGV